MGAFGEKGLKIFLSAGEASGDLHGASLARALLAERPESRLFCLGGELLGNAGAHVLVDNRDVAVVGLLEVFHHARSIYNAWKKTTAFLLREKPDLVILIDFPDFNFLLGRFAHGLGIKVFYYISPQVWAWRSGRVRSLRKFVDSMAVILPFERDFYRERGMEVHYVGHPLLDTLQNAASREEARLRYPPSDEQGPLIGLLPGSRRGEIRSLLPILTGAARRILETIPNASFILPVARTIDPSSIASEIDRTSLQGDDDAPAWKASSLPCDARSPHGAQWSRSRSSGAESEIRSALPVRVVAGDTYGVMRACDLLLAASGTVTLEAAILNVPMIVVYKVSPVTFHLGRHLVGVKHAALPNIIAGRPIVPELLQDDAREDMVAGHAVSLIRNPGALELQRNELARIQGMLGEPGVAFRVARLALRTLD